MPLSNYHVFTGRMYCSARIGTVSSFLWPKRHEWWSDTFASIVDQQPKDTTIQQNENVLFRRRSIQSSFAQWHFQGGCVTQLQTKFDLQRQILQHVLHFSSSIMIFSSPLSRNRTYAELFYKVETITSLRKIFHCVSWNRRRLFSLGSFDDSLPEKGEGLAQRLVEEV